MIAIGCVAMFPISEVALHMAALIRNEAMLNSLSEWWEPFQHNSTTHNATPQDLLDATSFTVQVSFGI